MAQAPQGLAGQIDKCGHRLCPVIPHALHSLLGSFSEHLNNLQMYYKSSVEGAGFPKI